MLKKIVTGGQTGVDRSALDVAIELNYKYGGWCPRGRKAEDGIIDPIKYVNLEETSTDHYPQRTEFNVRDSDGTLIIMNGNEDAMGRGTKLTVNMTKKHQKSLFIVNLGEEDKNLNEIKVMEWLMANQIEILNIAGPREQTTPGIYKQAETFLRSLLQKTKS
jgi:predicted Rossmann-fold nucleotide-binding protein